jgi:hypothetical protein
MRTIGDRVFVCGMGRQVYRRDPDATWHRHDNGCLLPLGQFAVVGFNAIAGWSADELVAVGYGGEIWRCQRGAWRKIPSPTNVVLTAVCCPQPDVAFACGQQGVLLRDDGDRWDGIDHHGTEDDLWGMTWHQGRLWVCSSTNLYRLDDRGRLERMTPGSIPDPTFLHLDSAGDALWTFGPNHVLHTADGKTWTDLLP